MPTTRQGTNSDAIEQLIAQRVAATLTAYEANRNSGNVNGNRNVNGNGNGSHSGGGSGSRRTLHTAHGCTYKEFLNCHPRNFKGTEEGCKTVGIDAAYDMSWRELMKIMTEVYCPRNEIQKLENELWNLTVKGTDVVSYTQCFQELALLCLKMVPDEEEKIERYIWGLPDNIQGNVTLAGPARLQDAIRLANSLMD
ncbi:reverse transcriptase domain-containing protein [Tanacetum coccineum]